MRQRTPFRRIGVAEAQALFAKSGAVSLDVRDPNSFRRGHIETCAMSRWLNRAGDPPALPGRQQ